MQIVKVGFNSCEKSENCSASPEKIVRVLKNFNSSENGVVFDFHSLSVDDILVNSKNLSESFKLIEQESEKFFYKNKKTFFLGGDHSISFPILKSFQKVEYNPLVILFDALGDFSESGEFPDYNEWVHALISQGFNPRNILLISGRNIPQKELEFLKKHEIVWIKMDVLREDIEGVCDLVMERARKSSGFYVSIDFNCLDSCFAPAGLELEPGGLSSGDLIYFLKRLNLLHNFRGGDLVNLNLKKDFNDITLKLAGRLIVEMNN